MDGIQEGKMIQMQSTQKEICPNNSSMSHSGPKRKNGHARTGEGFEEEVKISKRVKRAGVLLKTCCQGGEVSVSEAPPSFPLLLSTSEPRARSP